MLHLDGMIELTIILFLATVRTHNFDGVETTESWSYFDRLRIEPLPSSIHNHRPVFWRTLCYCTHMRTLGGEEGSKSN